MKKTVRIGTRKSELALKQTCRAADRMKEETPCLEVELVLKQTTGDKILDKPLLEFGGKGVFVSEFEEALQKGEIDFAVHSAKDLPMELAEGLEIVGVPKRADVRDVVVTRMDGIIEELSLIHIFGRSDPTCGCGQFRKLQFRIYLKYSLQWCFRFFL